MKTCQLTLKLEGEVVSQVPAFMIASQKEDGIGVPDLERPQVEDTLHRQDELPRKHQQVASLRTSMLKYPLST